MKKKSNKNAILIVLATLTSSTGNGLHFVAATWLIYELSNTAIAVGLFIALTSIPGILTFPFTGVIADRFDRKKVALYMDLGRALIVLLIPIGYLIDDSQIWILYIVTFLLTIGNNFFYPAVTGIIKSFPQELVVKVVSSNATAVQVGLLGGAAISGILVAEFSVYTIFYLNSLSFILSWLLLLFVNYKKESNGIQNSKVNYFKDTMAGLRYLKGNKILIFLFLVGIVPGGVVNMLNSLLSVYTIETLQESVKTYGILDAVIAVGNVFMGMAIVAIKKKFSPQKLIIISFGALSISLFIIGFTSNTIIAGFGLFLLGIFLMLGNVNTKTLIINTTDNEYIGRVESINWIAYSSIGPLIALIASSMATLTKVNYVFLGGGVLLLFVFIYCVLFFYRNGEFKNYKEKELTG